MDHKYENIPAISSSNKPKNKGTLLLMSGAVLLSVVGSQAYAYERKIIEAEDEFVVSEDYGNYDVESYNNASLSSNDYVALYDVNDMAGIPFYVDEFGSYDLGLRVRSGYKSWPVSHWRSGYAFYLDGEEVFPEFDQSSISDLDPVSSGTHWGIVRLNDTELEPGEHLIEVKALKAWSLLDYVEIGFDGEISQVADNRPVSKIDVSQASGIAPLEVKFNGSESSDDNGILEYRWKLDDGTELFGEYTNHVFTEAGDYLVSLEVVDTSGQISNSKVEISVESPQLPETPLPEAVQNTGRIEAEDNFTASADPGRYAIKSYDADQSSHQYISLYDIGDTAKIRFYVAEDGSYDLGARVRSGYKNWPVSHWKGGYSFTLDGKQVDFSGDKNSLSDFDSASSGSHWGTMRLDKQDLDIGYHNLEVKAQKNWGLFDYIEVEGGQGVNSTPTDYAPEAGIEASSTSGQAPFEVSFNAFKSSDDIGIQSYEWDFGDGSYDSNSTASHTYTEAGSYTAKLTVTDTSGQPSINTVTVKVSSATAEPPPTVNSADLKTVSEPMVINAKHNVVIENMHFTGSAFRNSGRAAIHIIGDSSNIEIRNCLFENVDWAIRIQGGKDINIHGNRFEKIGMAIRADDVKGGLKVEYNEALHLGAWDITPYFPGYWGQTFMGLVNSSGRNSSISYNVIDNEGVPSKYLEDMTNLWNAGGSSDSYLKIVGNKYRGSSLPGNVSITGGGIIVGDGAGSDGAKGWYVKVQDNLMVRTQSYGIGGAGGFNLEFLDNTIYLPADHTKVLSQHPHHHGQKSGGAGVVFTQYSGNACGNILFKGNESHAIGWTNNATTQYPLPKSITKSCSGMSYTDNQWLNSPGSLGDHLLPDDMFSGLSADYFSANH